MSFITLNPPLSFTLPPSIASQIALLTHQQCLNSRVIPVICCPVYSRLAIWITQNNISTLSGQQNNLLHQQRRDTTTTTTKKNLQLSITTWHFQHCCCKRSNVVPSSVHNIHTGNEWITQHKAVKDFSTFSLSARLISSGLNRRMMAARHWVENIHAKLVLDLSLSLPLSYRR